MTFDPKPVSHTSAFSPKPSLGLGLSLGLIKNIESLKFENRNRFSRENRFSTKCHIRRFGQKKRNFGQKEYFSILFPYFESPHCTRPPRNSTFLRRLCLCNQFFLNFHPLLVRFYRNLKHLLPVFFTGSSHEEGNLIKFLIKSAMPHKQPIIRTWPFIVAKFPHNVWLHHDNTILCSLRAFHWALRIWVL